MLQLGQLSEALLHAKSHCPPPGPIRLSKSSASLRRPTSPSSGRATFQVKASDKCLYASMGVLWVDPLGRKSRAGAATARHDIRRHRPYSRSVIAAAGKIYNHTAQLIDNVGALLTITTVPPGAEVRLDSSVLSRSLYDECL